MKLDVQLAVVRPFSPGDVDALVRHGNDRNVWRNLRDAFPFPYTPADARAWIAYARSGDPELHFAIEVDGEAAGGIGCVTGTDVHRHIGEVGYWLGKTYWGRGIMTQVLRAYTAWLFERRELLRLEAPVYEWNPASARVLEKAGYTLEARQRKRIYKDGEFIDQLLYVRLSDDR